MMFGHFAAAYYTREIIQLAEAGQLPLRHIHHLRSRHADWFEDG